MVDNLTIKDALGDTKTVRTKDVGTVDAPLHIPGSTPFDSYNVPLFQLTNPGKVGMADQVQNVVFQRPADTTQYSAFDLVANDTIAANVAPMVFQPALVSGGTARIHRGRLFKSGASLSNAIFRAHFYNKRPTFNNGDNGAWLSTNGNFYAGSMDFDFTGTAARAFADGACVIGAPSVGSFIMFNADVNSTSLFAVLEVRAAYLPASGEFFSLWLELAPN